MIKKFTHAGYKSLLQTALNSGYHFFRFNDENLQSCDKFCLLRHDIDISLEVACQMSEIEKKLGIRATYFLMLRSPIYNLFSRANSEFVKKIISNGHYIGLHYDEGYYLDDRNLEELIKIEIKVIEDFFHATVKVVSFHQPGNRVLNGDIKLNGLINTYCKEDLSGIQYISDSNKVWKEIDPWTIFSKEIYKKIHLLIHPIWWMSDEDRSTEELWDRALLGNFELLQNQILATERAFGNKRSFQLRKYE